LLRKRGKTVDGKVRKKWGFIFCAGRVEGVRLPFFGHKRRADTWETCVCSYGFGGAMGIAYWGRRKQGLENDSGRGGKSGSSCLKGRDNSKYFTGMGVQSTAVGEGAEKSQGVQVKFVREKKQVGL